MPLVDDQRRGIWCKIPIQTKWPTLGGERSDVTSTVNKLVEPAVKNLAMINCPPAIVGAVKFLKEMITW